MYEYIFFVHIQSGMLQNGWWPQSGCRCPPWGRARAYCREKRCRREYVGVCSARASSPSVSELADTIGYAYTSLPKKRAICEPHSLNRYSYKKSTDTILMKIVPMAYNKAGADRESDGLGAPLAVTGLSKLNKAWLFLDLKKFITKYTRGLI